MRDARLDETQTEIKIAGRNINNLRYADDTTHGRKQRRTKELLDEGERGEWKNWLKTQHSKETKIMASGSITSWQIDGETMETVIDFIFLGFKITADGDCSHNIKRCLLLGKKAMTNLESVLKSRDITHKGLSSQSYGFSSSHDYECESWTIKKAEHWRTDAFELWSWRRLLRVLWTPQRSNQSLLKEMNLNIHWKDWCWSSSTLVMWCEELTHWKSSWCWERLKAEGEGDGRGWDGWMASSTPWIWIWASSGSWWWKVSLMCCRPWGFKESDMTERLNWTELNWEGDKMIFLFWDLLWSMKKTWLCCFPSCPHSCGHKYLLLLIWGKWFYNFCIYLMWIAKFLGNTLNSFSNLKGHESPGWMWRPAKSWWDHNNALTSCFEGAACWEEQRSFWARQLSVDLGREAVLKMHWKQNLAVMGYL